jgi:hypothetical protein
MSNVKQRLPDGALYVGPATPSWTDDRIGGILVVENDDSLKPANVENSASKNDSEKPDLSHIPTEFLAAVAQAFMVGEKKYGRYNYYKGHKASQLIAAAMRHLTAWMNGEENDPVDGQPHLGSVGACVAMLLKQKALGTLKDNRYGKDDK